MVKVAQIITDWVTQQVADAVLDDDGNVVTPAKEEIVRMGVKEQQMMWMAIKALQEPHRHVLKPLKHKIQICWQE